MNRLLDISVLMLALLAVSCETDNEVQDGTTPPAGNPSIMERSPKYINSNLIYNGSEGLTESDGWVLNLYTDMKIEDGYPVGPGQSISLSFNAEFNPAQEPDLDRIAGTYVVQSNTGDFSPGTFIPGYEEELGIPGQEMLVQSDSFFADIPEGSTEYDADLLREGEFTITDNGDDTWTVEGILVGTDYIKRYVHFTGPLDPVDRSHGGATETIPNSNLTGNIALDGTAFTKAKLIDYGSSYGTPSDLKESYKKFLLYIAEETVDLTSDWPAGSGRLLRIEVFVPGDTDMEDGLPSGGYTMSPMRPDGGISSTDMVPFRIIPGVPDTFELNSGTWYQEISDGAWVNYARIAGGTITVERNGDAHKIDISLTDCSEPAFAITCAWSRDEAIPAIDRNYYD